ncbi:MAG TPA: GNAT family protein [Thermomicrobiales bacterium]|nr:GNAT family protein [Thermomicrobiales bacterium]
MPERPLINFEGGRVALGPLRRELLPRHQAWINDFSALRTLGVVAPRPTTFEQETDWCDRAQQSDAIRFTIYERATWEPIGNTGLNASDARDRTAVFGILIGEPAARGKGYGTEATRLVLDDAFHGLGLHSVMLTCAEFNWAGRRAYANAGFREFGRRRQCRWLADRLWDDISMDCLADEFASLGLAALFAPDPTRPPDDAAKSASDAARIGDRRSWRESRSAR